MLLYSSAAAAAAVLGVVPLIGRGQVPVRWIGWSNALAAGLMLGAAYALMVTGLDWPPMRGAMGAAVGVGFVHWTHMASRTADLDLNRLGETDPAYGYQVLLINALHSAAEGIAIGVAMVVSPAFGAFMALAMAVHNIPEATVLSAILRSGGVRLPGAAGLSVVSNVSQVLLSVVTFAVVTAAPGTLPWVLGFAFGALVHLVMVEPLPQSYRQAGPTSIALVTLVAMGMVVLVRSMGA